MSRRGPIKNWTEYLLFCGAWRCVGLMRPRLAGRFIRGAGWLLQTCWKGRRLDTIRVVSQTLGLPADSPEVKRIVRGAFDAFAATVVEGAVLEREYLRTGSLEHRITVEGLEHWQAARRTGRGVLLCSGHLGAWAMTTAFMALTCEPVWVVLRPPNNPLVKERFDKHEHNGIKGWIDRRRAARQIAAILQGGEPLLVLLDQRPRSKVHSLTLDFLGRPTLHDAVGGRLARRFEALAVPVYVLRESEAGHYRVVFEEPMEVDPGLSESEAEADLTARLSASLARRVQEHPEQWNWLHDRWKSPTGSGRGRTTVPASEGTTGA